ncbi:hypothetical protein N7468_005589 [Penicillium chermesinum]|uniref:Rhodopsin domain-containing protein n=1 Tax=Penicillium chermesinum TaxID=63820 RepID=A0A9W9P248_9EURO|nr:uncharacterized protein N7468_005589 [Penicillium chermesinum]KAJ5232633.1 hypothetical protein N7468_005589 [Penicillium chermesinum]KAJ6172291.1 hypothetical protein N7470_001358 [Penicillium chermesinum]
MASFVILWAVAIFVTGTLNCIPVNKFWDPSIQGYCIDSATFYYGMQIPNILSDLIILLMPVKVVIQLPVARSQKFLLSAVFLVGGLTLVFDIVRLWVMIGLTHSGPDITYQQAPVAMWTCLEGAVAIVGACLPNFRPLFRFSQRGFWSQLRSSGQQSGKTLLNSNTTNTTSTTVTSPTSGSQWSANLKKPSLMSHVTEDGTQGIEIHRYSKYTEGESK